MEWMKELLKAEFEDEAKLEEVLEAFKKEFPKHAVPKNDFNQANNELKETKSKLEETAKMMEEFKSKASTVEEYQTKVGEWEEKYKEFEGQAEERLKTVVKKSAVKDLLVGKVPKSAVELILDKVDYTGIELTEKNEITKAEELVEKFKGDYGDLFITEETNSNKKDEHNKGKPEPKEDEALRRVMGLV